MRIAILSDTHGLLRPRVLELAAGSDRILHAGDVGKASILERLREIAPVEAVCGNMDRGELSRLPAVAAGELAGLPCRMTHRREDIANLWTREARLIVFGHSHRPELEWRGGCLLLNPGAVGARRFTLPLTMAFVTVIEDRLVPEIVSVEDTGQRPVLPRKSRLEPTEVRYHSVEQPARERAQRRKDAE